MSYRVAVQRTGRSCTLLALDRTERPGFGNRLPTLLSALQIGVAVRTRASCVRRGTKLPNQTQLLERGLELRSEDSPLDPLERAERGFHRRPLPPAREVRPEPRAKVACLADVEHHLIPVVEEVDARSGRRPCDKRPLGVELTRTGSSQLDEIADGSRASLLSEPHQRDQDLGRRKTSKGPVARLDRDAEEVGEPGEREALAPAREEAPRQPHRVENGCCAPSTRQVFDLAVEERHVEARVVRDERRVAREGEEPAQGDLDPRGAAQVDLPDPRQRGDGRRERGPGVDEGLERLDDFERLDPHGADLAHATRARGEPRRLEIEHHELGLLERRVRRVTGGADARPEPDETTSS
jgi:hypothetical protein